MPFVKLDCDMLESSLWDWTPERHIFITALLMAKPHELTDPAPQLEADSLNLTGWVVPPGQYGFVKASGAMLLKKALTLTHVDSLDGSEEFADAMNALRALGEPDMDSRSQAWDGRRLVRIDGGYIVLNFQRFRDKDHTATDRKRKQREREKVSRRDVTPSHGKSLDVTQAEAEAEAEANTESESIKRWIAEAVAKNRNTDPRVVEVAVIQTMIRRRENSESEKIRSVSYFLPEIATVRSGFLGDEQMDGILQRRRQQAGISLVASSS